MIDNPVYEPDDDTYLLADALLEELSSLKKQKIDFSKLSLLDMGSGNGYIANVSLKKKIPTTLVDINSNAISFLNSKFSKNKLSTIIESDLFSNVPSSTFDIITFNTPYLPDDEDLIDPALHGGPMGYEVTVNFLDQVSNYLKKSGVLIFLISSLTHPDVIEAKLYKQGLKHKIVGRKKLFFEELLVYRVVFNV